MNKYFKILFLKILIKTYFLYRDFCNAMLNLIYRYPKLSLSYGCQFFFLKNIKQGDTILDLGCNRGNLTVLLSEKASHIDAFDILENDIEYAKKYNRRNNIDFNARDATLVIESCYKHYDVVLLSGLLTFINDPGGFLKKISGITDLVLIRETKFDNEILAMVAKDLGIKKSKWREFTKNELIELIINSGYIIIEDYDSYDMFFAVKPLK